MTAIGSFFLLLLREGGVILVKYNRDEVEEPGNRTSAYDPDDTYNEKHVVLISCASYDTVYRPHDVKRGKAKNELEYKGEIVHHFDKILHISSPFL